MTETKEKVECICTQPGQARIDSQIWFFQPGDTASFAADDIPWIFERVTDIEINFATSTESELLLGNYPVTDLQAYIHKTYKKRISSTDKEALVKALLDFRFREV